MNNTALEWGGDLGMNIQIAGRRGCDNWMTLDDEHASSSASWYCGIVDWSYCGCSGVIEQLEMHLTFPRGLDLCGIGGILG